MKAIILFVLALICCTQVYAKLPDNLLKDMADLDKLKPEAESLTSPAEAVLSDIPLVNRHKIATVPQVTSVLPPLPAADLPIIETATPTHALQEIQALQKHEHDKSLIEAEQMSETELPAVDSLIKSAQDIDASHPVLEVLGEKPEPQQPHHSFSEVSASHNKRRGGKRGGKRGGGRRGRGRRGRRGRRAPKPENPADARMPTPAVVGNLTQTGLKGGPAAANWFNSAQQSVTEHIGLVTPHSDPNQHERNYRPTPRPADIHFKDAPGGWLTQSDARCVICQYVVQRIHRELSIPGAPSTKTLASATTDNNNANSSPAGTAAPAAAPAADASAAPAADASAAPAAPAAADGGVEAPAAPEATPTAAIELESEASFLEFQVAVDAEAAELASLNAFATEWLAAADAAQEHSAHEAVATYFQRKDPTKHMFQYGPDQRRFRTVDQIASRADDARYNSIFNPLPTPDRQKQRAEYQKLYTQVYSSFSTLCSQHFPLAYLPYCEAMLKDYRYVAQGLHFGDRIETICMNGNYCDKKSYIRDQPHSQYIREAGDS